MPKKNPKSTLKSLTDQEIRELALGIFRQEIFTDRHIAPTDQHITGSIFMPLSLMSKKQLLDLQRKQRPGMIYAKMRNAGPRSINGYPMFMEISLVRPDDAVKVWEEYKRISTTV
jgi:hypothetical protein